MGNSLALQESQISDKVWTGKLWHLILNTVWIGKRCSARGIKPDARVHAGVVRCSAEIPVMKCFTWVKFNIDTSTPLPVHLLFCGTSKELVPVITCVMMGNKQSLLSFEISKRRISSLLQRNFFTDFSSSSFQLYLWLLQSKSRCPRRQFHSINDYRALHATVTSTNLTGRAARIQECSYSVQTHWVKFQF